MPELIADTRERYVDLNVRLALDDTWRKELREMLRERLRISPLMDAPSFTRNLEGAYREMWVRWCQRDSSRSPARGASASA